MTTRTLLLGGELATYRVRNLRTRLRGWRQEIQRWFGVGVLAELTAVHTRADGTVRPLGVLSRRVVTTAAVTAIAENMSGDTTPTISSYNYHAMGGTATAEAIGDTALGSEFETRVAGVQSNPAAGQYRTVATITATATRVVKEHGVLTASSGGTLLDRSGFAEINLGSGDTLTFTYTLTLSAGG